MKRSVGFVGEDMLAEEKMEMDEDINSLTALASSQNPVDSAIEPQLPTYDEEEVSPVRTFSGNLKF